MKGDLSAAVIILANFLFATYSLLWKEKKKGKEMNLPSLSKARLHIDTNYYLLLISLVITGSGSALEFTDYPEQHKPELSECQKREFPRLNSIEKSLKLWNKRNRNRRDRKNVQCCFFFSAGCLFKWILGCNRSLWAMLADSDEKKVSCPWFVSVLSPRSIIQFFFCSL